uniref:Uncharacterized protein n=1 Tax=Rhizophora mucronata TaxID=61149 RepID=A0A2P2N3K8_RHIMU
MELATTTNGLLGPIVPPDTDFNVVTMIGLKFFHVRHVRRLVGVRWAHQHTIAQSNNFVGAFDSV